MATYKSNYLSCDFDFDLQGKNFGAARLANADAALGNHIPIVTVGPASTTGSQRTDWSGGYELGLARGRPMRLRCGVGALLQPPRVGPVASETSTPQNQICHR